MDTIITLPDRDDMLARLTSVMDDPHMTRGLYPKLLEQAGTQKTPRGVALMWALAVHDYTTGMPPVVQMTTSMLAPAFVRALIDDEAARAETLAAIN
jgi:hypothetical protein